MRKLLPILGLILPTLGMAAEEPTVIAPARASFLKSAADAGVDAGKCKMEFLETMEAGHLVRVSCAELPHACLFLIHKTEPMSAPVKCYPNPEFIGPQNKT